MVTLGNHYNGYLNGNVSTNDTRYLAVTYYKYYSKNISITNSRFMNNNQPINKSLYFNVSNTNNGFLHSRQYLFHNT